MDNPLARRAATNPTQYNIDAIARKCPVDRRSSDSPLEALIG
jgi:hypothetical protein